jgi:hypothetical protein
MRASANAQTINVSPRQQNTVRYASEKKKTSKNGSLSSLVQLCFSREQLEVYAFEDPGLVVPFNDRSVSDILFVWVYVFGFYLANAQLQSYISS